MAEIVNLKRAKKAKARAAAEEIAATNRSKFGTPKAERKLVEAKREKDVEKVDGHRLDNNE